MVFKIDLMKKRRQLRIEEVVTEYEKMGKFDGDQVVDLFSTGRHPQ